MKVIVPRDEFRFPVSAKASYERLKFRYTNWRGDDHEYVVHIEQFAFGRYSNEQAGSGEPLRWVLHGAVVTRDGDLRPDMGPNRRRTFILSEIREPELLP